MIQTRCPDAARLRALITDPDLPDYADLESHLAHCTRCQARLDEIAVGSSGWLRDAGRLAASTAKDPEMTRTLHRLRDYLPDDAHGPPIPLDFLTPSNQPGLLGTLGRYQVLEVIGRGAMGIVLKAIDPDLLRPVAIKVMAPYLASSGTARARFLREARAAAAVSHDHIVTIHAVEPGDLPYLVMEFVSGISLQARLDRDGPLPPRDIARIGLQAANGLAAAHAVGLVHRDVKPANILLENGVERVKITDFGLARAADDARLTQSGTAAGTPLYMSPEQARGETVDPRSDLFSLGSVLYTLATGFPPFRAGSTMGVLNRIANDPPRPIRETVPDFPAALEAIIMQMLDKDPTGRFQVAADVSVKLTGFLADPQAAPSPPADAPRRRRRLPKWWETALPILAGILVLGTVLYFKTRQGTLVVEVDDPAVKVQIDGDDLTITGAGTQEVRVKPGTYHVRTSKDGKPIGEEVVTITRNGKQVVKVTVKPDPEARAWGPTREQEFLNRFRGLYPDAAKEREAMMLQAYEAARSKTPPFVRPDDPPSVQAHPSYAKVQKRLLELESETDPNRQREILTDAYKLALAIEKETDELVNAPWDAKVRALTDRVQSIHDRLPPTEVRRAVAFIHGGKPPESFLTGLPESDRAKARKFIALEEQFGLLLPKVQAAVVRLGKVKQDLAGRTQRERAVQESAAAVAAAADRVKDLEAKVAGDFKVLDGLVTDLEGVALELGARPAPPPGHRDPDRIDTGWEGRTKKLAEEFQALSDRLSKTPVGRVLTTAGPGADPDKATAGLSKDDAFTARRLLVLRDQFAGLVPRSRNELADWEQARLAARNAHVKFEAGAIAADDLEKADLTLKAAERALTATEKAMERIVADLRTLADELKAPAEGPSRAQDAAEAEFKKVVAEYDALTLRLVSTPVGRALALSEQDKPSESDLSTGGVPPASWPVAYKLLALRAKIIGQKTLGQMNLTELHATDKIDRPWAVPGLKFRTGALRGLVDDFKKLADEIDPPPGPDAELQKLMAEYDALVLRLAETRVGRVLALYPPQNSWQPDEVRKQFGGRVAEGDLAVWLLEKRTQIQTQADRARGALTVRSNLLRQKAEQATGKAKAGDSASLDEGIRNQEQDVKLATIALRGLIGELKKFADENESPKGK
jgi:serine/threonine protein kinase